MGMMGLLRMGVPMPMTQGGGGDTTAPTILLESTAPATVYEAFPLTITASEPIIWITGLTVGNGTATAPVDSGDGMTWTSTITPTASGIVTVDVAAGAAQDAAGNDNTAAVQLSRTAIIYLLRDEFITAEDAPLTSPRTAEPGPGTATISDTAAVIGGGKLIINTFNRVYQSTTTFARQTGRAFYMVDYQADKDAGMGGYLVATNQAIIGQEGLGAKADLAVGRDRIVWNGSAGVKVAGVDKSLMDVPDFSGFGIYRYMLICRTSGGFALVGGEAFGNRWYLVHVRSTLTNTNLRLAACSYNLRDVFGDLTVADLGGVWADDFGIATHRTETPVGTVTATGTADAELEVTWTPGADETLELSCRRVDDDNRLIVRCIQADGTINLIERSGGVESSLSGGTVAQTWDVGTDYRVIVRYQGTRVDVVVDGTRHASGTTAISAASTGIQVSGGATLANFIAWPIDVTAHVPAVFTVTQKNILPFGDSKTAGAVTAGYPLQLARLMCSEDAAWWQESPLRFGQGGATMAYWASHINTAISGATTVPTVILCNIGVNDVNGDSVDVLRDGTGVAWKADADTVLNALHTAYPDAQIYFMRVWKRGDATVQSKLDFINDTMIPAFISERPYCHAGPDERVFLENGDDGATYTTDGIHPTADGYTLTAQQWSIVLLADLA